MDRKGVGALSPTLNITLPRAFGKERGKGTCMSPIPAPRLPEQTIFSCKLARGERLHLQGGNGKLKLRAVPEFRNHPRAGGAGSVAKSPPRIGEELEAHAPEPGRRMFPGIGDLKFGDGCPRRRHRTTMRQYSSFTQF